MRDEWSAAPRRPVLEPVVGRVRCERSPARCCSAKGSEVAPRPTAAAAAAAAGPPSAEDAAKQVLRAVLLDGAPNAPPALLTAV